MAEVCCTNCTRARRVDQVHLCTSCRGNKSAPIYYCFKHCSQENHESKDCRDATHETCFEAHLPSIPSVRAIHQSEDAIHHWCISQITYSAEDYNEQQEYHRNDQRAEWFRVESTPFSMGVEATLQVSQRFDSIWRAAYPIGRAQYPSFVSFMGNTGVGKSTLVRAMMMTGVLESMREKALDTTLTNDSGNWLNFDHVIECRARGPVTRPGLADLASVATSVGVHLYHDPVIGNVSVKDNRVEDDDNDEAENVSVLFADCEGFYGDRPTATTGTSLTVPNVGSSRRSGSRSRSHSRRVSAASSIAESFSSSPAEAITEEDARRKLRYKEIPIKAPSLRGRGKAGSELFYARYLYAFSDVVVFVTKSPQSLGSELGDFLTWIAKAEKHSIPPRSPRTLVIVINRNDYHSPKYYSEAYLKDKMFDGLGDRRIWELSDELNALKENYDKEYIARADRITNNDKFFRLFFQDVRICYIPEDAKDAAENQYRQYKMLRDMIMTGSRQGQNTRSERWSRYDVPTVSQLLDKAFAHYATRDTAFDFHGAAGKDNPTPISLAGHIANLLRHTGTNKSQLLRFADVVASCLITYEYRSTIHAREPDKNFTSELGKHCQTGIEIFLGKFLKCAFKWFDGTFCTTRGFEHDSRQGHRHLDRMVIQGTMDQSLFESTAEELLHQIRRRFVMMYEELHVEGRKPAFETLRDFRRQILGFEPSVSYLDGSAIPTLEEFQSASPFFATAKSNKTCFSCLQAAPDHFLPCGHGYCPDCVKDFGRASPHARYVYLFQQCVLCGPTTTHRFETYEIRLDPRAAGVRLLTLDGGGVRGVIEIQLLMFVMEQVNLDRIPVMELFDLMVGTSTGGIISLGLGTAASDDLTLQDLLDSFMSLAKSIFEKDRLWFISTSLYDLGAKIGYGLLFIGVLRSRYPSKPRKDALLKFFSEDKQLFGFAPVRKTLSRGTRVAVTASSKVACTFANYSRSPGTSDQTVDQLHLGADRGFIREDAPSNEPKVWEAAMATSAAPGYFVPWKVDGPHTLPESRREFTDGAVQSNMPLLHALLEKNYIWPSKQGPRPLDISVSVGTGFAQTHLSLPSWLKKGNVQEMIEVYHNNVLNSENMWQQFKNNTTGYQYQEGVNYRLNVETDKRVDLDEWKQMLALQQATVSAYDNPDTGLRRLVDDIAFELVGKLFFFEPERCVAHRGNKREYIRGQIWTRLDCNKFVAANRSLLWRIRGFYHLEGTDLEQMQPVNSFHTTGLGFGHSRQSWDQIQQRMSQNPHIPFNLSYNIEHTVDLTIEQSIFVELLPSRGATQPSRKVRISGFPSSYGELLGITQKRRGVQEYPQ